MFQCPEYSAAGRSYRLLGFPSWLVVGALIATARAAKEVGDLCSAKVGAARRAVRWRSSGGWLCRIEMCSLCLFSVKWNYHRHIQLSCECMMPRSTSLPFPSCFSFSWCSVMPVRWPAYPCGHWRRTRTNRQLPGLSSPRQAYVQRIVWFVSNWIALKFERGRRGKISHLIAIKAAILLFITYQNNYR